MARSQPTYLMVFASQLAAVCDPAGGERDGELKDNLLDRLDCPAADPALIALRKAFSLTYPDEPTLASVKGAVEQVRALCVDALKPLAAVLTALRLKPVAPETEEDRKKSFVFKYVFCPRKEADIKVECEGAACSAGSRRRRPTT